MNFLAERQKCSQHLYDTNFMLSYSRLSDNVVVLLQKITPHKIYNIYSAFD